MVGEFGLKGEARTSSSVLPAHVGAGLAPPRLYVEKAVLGAPVDVAPLGRLVDSVFVERFAHGYHVPAVILLLSDVEGVVVAQIEAALLLVECRNALT